MATIGSRSATVRAAQFEELADALDAGIDPAAALAASGARLDRDRGIAAALAALDPHIPAATRAALEAAEGAGRLPPALRRAAATLRAGAARRRELAGRLAYPATLVVMALVVGTIASVAVRSRAALAPAVVGFAVCVALALAAGWLTRRAHRDPGFPIERVPTVGGLCADLAAAAWLDTMATLTAAGIALPRAHPLATRTVGFARERARLTAATAALDAGERLTVALAGVGALDAETVDSIGRAEHAGTLEQTFERLARFRSERAARRAARLTRAAGAVAYAIAAAIVLATVLAFYSRLFAGLAR